MSDASTESEERVQQEWSLGSYAVLARSFAAVAAALVDRAGVEPGDRVLDVACGSGNVALTAHRRGARVAGLDITPAMLEMAREQASIVDADIDWRQGDAGALPVGNDEFDVTLSCLGCMFVPDTDAAASELVRVTKPGGRIGYVSWTPQSSFAAMMATLASHLPPDSDAPPPFLWGDPDTVRDRFGDSVRNLRFETDVVRFPALSPEHFWHSMTTDAGPLVLALEELDDDRRAALRDDEVNALQPWFAEAVNAMEIEYRLVTATVA